MKLEIVAKTSLYSCRSYYGWERSMKLQKSSQRPLSTAAGTLDGRRLGRVANHDQNRAINRSQKGTEKSVYHIALCPDLIFIGINNNTS
jgi:hypothetical protein